MSMLSLEKDHVIFLQKFWVVFLFFLSTVATVGNHVRGEMALHTRVCALFTTNLFFFTFCLHSCVFPVCDTVKWFLAFVRHKKCAV